MPELPEVETVVRTLAPRLTGRRIEDAKFFSKHVVRQNFNVLAKRIRGKTVQSVERHGKFIVIALDAGTLVVHLGMTGKLLMDAQPGPYTRALFELDSGLLVYDDIRHFGRIEYDEKLPKRVARLGPDAFHISVEEFIARLRKHRSMIKPLLMNQTFVRGMGNIYTDEALFAARIHPRAIASRLRRPCHTAARIDDRDSLRCDRFEGVLYLGLRGFRGPEGNVPVASPGLRSRGGAVRGLRDSGAPDCARFARDSLLSSMST